MTEKQIATENIDTGVIYRITNSVNNKVYYGQSASYRFTKGKYVRHGHIGRFHEHCKAANNGKDSCPKLYNAIRKHGDDKFKSEIVVVCGKDKLDENESHYIVSGQTHIVGYNVITHNITCTPASGKTRIERIQNTMFKKWEDSEYADKTTSANLKAVIKRAEEGKTRKEENKELPNNIYECENGYDIRIMRYGKYKITSVTSTTETKEELLGKAIKMRDKLLNDFENGTIKDHVKKLDHNGNPLPKCITCRKARGNDGYSVIVTKDGKRKDKMFTDGSKTMDEKLELAKEYLKNYTEITKTDNPQASS